MTGLVAFSRFAEALAIAQIPVDATVRLFRCACRLLHLYALFPPLQYLGRDHLDVLLVNYKQYFYFAVLTVMDLFRRADAECASVLAQEQHLLLDVIMYFKTVQFRLDTALPDLLPPTPRLLLMRGFKQVALGLQLLHASTNTPLPSDVGAWLSSLSGWVELDSYPAAQKAALSAQYSMYCAVGLCVCVNCGKSKVAVKDNSGILLCGGCKSVGLCSVE